MKVAVGGLHMECSTYNHVKAVEKDFRLLRGEGLLAHEYFAFFKDYPATFLPIMHARAIAGGPISRDTYERFKAELLEGFDRLKPYDGIYLAMHGAMFVEGIEDSEGDFISAVREVAGPDCLIAASYDLHGNVSQRIVNALDIFSTYRTAPHIDVEETMRRSVTMLVKALASGERPGIVWSPIPVLMPGERSSTVDEPARSLYAMLPALEQPQGIWDASLQVGYVWADEPRATACAVMTGTDRATMEGAAIALAEAYWNKRHDFAFGVETGSIEECVSKAVQSSTGPVILAESGDNPTGGGVGDRADMLAALIEVNAQGVIMAGIADAPATAACFEAGIGVAISLSIGATLDPSSKPVHVNGKVLRLVDVGERGEREAVVQLGGITLVLAEKRLPYHNLSDFARLGLDPRSAAIVAVKSGYLSPELAPLANPALLALSPGAVDQHVERLPRLRKSVPTFPWDRDFAFTPKALASVRFKQERGS